MEEQKKKKRKQIAFDIDPEKHSQIKIAASKRGISMNLFIVIAIQAELRKDYEKNDLRPMQNRI